MEDVVGRYLGAFGPATVADAQQWSGLTRLREVIERMDLRTFRDESGSILYDLPDAPRPDAAVPAPVRLLPEYDNLLLSHRDRSRVNPGGRTVPLPPGNGAREGTVLIDGFWNGTWTLRDRQVRIAPFGPLSEADEAAVQREAARLTAFLTDEVTPRPAHPG